MINIKEIKGMHDDVKQTTASAPDGQAASLNRRIC